MGAERTRRFASGDVYFSYGFPPEWTLGGVSTQMFTVLIFSGSLTSVKSEHQLGYQSESQWHPQTLRFWPLSVEGFSLAPLFPGFPVSAVSVGN